MADHAGNTSAERPDGPPAALLRVVLDGLAQVLDIPAEQVPAQSEMLDQGLSSLLAMELMDVLATELRLDLEPEVIFDYPTPEDLAAYLAARVADRDDGVDAHLAQAGDEAIAVIGFACRFADLPTPSRLWTALRDGECRVDEVRREGWDASQFYHPDRNSKTTSVSKWGGMLDRIDAFDPLFFNISPREAKRMDPQQRIFLEEAYRAFESAGYPDHSLAGRRVAVFVGARGADYKEHVIAADGSSAHSFLGNDMAVLAGRVSYFFDLRGPCLVIDAACSSALVAIHLACESLRRGEADMALAGGVFVVPSPRFLIEASQSAMLSPTGACRAFDDDADGMAVGEGAGALVLKPLRQALADDDYVHGVIRGSATGHNGRTQGITAPASAQLAELVRELYDRIGVSPGTISYLEAQGTGTKLGDKAELAAMADVFAAGSDRTGFCAIGSLKPNIGHAITAAGAAAVIKVLLAMRHRQLPPTIGFRKLNRAVHLTGGPFYINTALRSWEPACGAPRRAAINSFAFNGTSCHLVVEEAPAGRPLTGAAWPAYLLPVSARSPEALRQRLDDLRAWLRDADQEIDLDDIAYTLQVGRAHMPWRTALVVGDRSELAATLDDVIATCCPGPIPAGKAGGAGDCELSVKPLRRLRESRAGGAAEARRESSSYREDMRDLAELYLAGCDIDWQEMYELNGISRRIPLPTYPFTGQRCWLDGRVS